MARVIVKFTASWRGYSKDEIAGFEEDVAQSLIDGGRAELVDAKKAKTGSRTKPPTGKAGVGEGQPGPAATDPNAGDDTDPGAGGDTDAGGDDDKP
ncbi:hypothetical protein PZ739_05935 [Pseudomonas kermanshahensis]|uniref:hypothetical protein n=1 Tax=Pseudomonas kermanshahensis TaxID=2745482 RepID=UPI0023DA891A|nr:hypothetical protein [Pseudomonas kermanshahensis]WEL56706.1 hypothetical protein PZ739_05935 [Pseudomonas kermanshahensis]